MVTVAEELMPRWSGAVEVLWLWFRLGSENFSYSNVLVLYDPVLVPRGVGSVQLRFRVDAVRNAH